MSDLSTSFNTFAQSVENNLTDVKIVAANSLKSWHSFWYVTDGWKVYPTPDVN